MTFFSRLVIPVFIAVAAAVLPHTVGAAIFSAVPSDVAVEIGRTVPVTLMVDSQGESINVVAATVKYSKDILELVSVSKAGSFLSLWPDEPTGNAATGSVTFSGGIPNGTVAASGNMLTLLFRGIARGVGTITFDTTQTDVYLNDGSGTRGAVTAHSTNVRVLNQDGFSPRLGSSTHPDESRWSVERTFVVSWQWHEGAFYSYMLSREATAVPDDSTEQTDGHVSFPNLSDGVWYFTLKEKLGDDPWGPVASFRVMIDGTLPEPIDAAIIRDDPSHTWLLSFSAIDTTSGLTETLVVERRPVFSWFPFFLRAEHTAATTPYRLHDQRRLSELKIIATDGAGNSRTLLLVNSQLARQRWIVAGLLLVLVILVIILVVRKRTQQTKFLS